jgi:rsbT co-antagonist protein RsbR
MLNGDLNAENERLRANIASVEQFLDEQERVAVEQATRLEKTVAELEEQTRLLEATFMGIADGVAVCNAQGILTRLNVAAEEILGIGRFEGAPEDSSTVYGLFRRDGVTIYPPDDLPLARALRGEAVDGEELFIRNTKRPEGVWMHVSARPLQAEDGSTRGAVAIFHDVSERKRWEKELEAQLAREKQSNDMLRRLSTTVAELSTPILEVWDDVLALPVIGVVDSRRSAEMMARLLEEITRTQCRFVILDVTGVDVVDTSTADRFIQLVHAVELIGARCMLTGIRSAVAQTLVSLGMDLGPLTTLRTLKHGIRECLRLMALEQDRPQPKQVLTARRAP